MQKVHPKTIKLIRQAVKVVAPPPKLTISEWADNYRKLSSESSSEAGQWRTSRAPYQREIMDAISNPLVENVVLMCGAQLGKTEALLNTIGYYIDYDPAPIMYVMPTVEMAEGFSKDRVEPMFRDTPTLRAKTEEKERDKNSTILHKRFAGGHLTLVGANSSASLASRPIRIVLMDEVDRFPVNVGDEGDPVSLVQKRTATFHNRKHVMVSTPTVKGVSRIEEEYNQSTMEEWCLACPKCGEYNPLTWGAIKFEKDGNGEYQMQGMECERCLEVSKEYEWKANDGKWIAKKPENKEKRGFHLNELASPWSSWESIMKDFLAKKDNPQMLKTWVNTSLGESWEEQSEIDAGEIVSKRREYYNCEVPSDVLVLTCSVDVQDNRLEYEVCGWGRGFESWGIRYGVIMGNPTENYVWNQLDLILDKQYTKENGDLLKIMCCCVDSGYLTDEVYKYCKPREMKRIFAIKGVAGNAVPLVKIPKRRENGVFLFNVGVDTGKDTIMSWLKIEHEGDGFCHFPIEVDRGYDLTYFEGLTSEKRITKYKNGKPYMIWAKIKSGARNEPLDLRNYNTAAINILNPQWDLLEDAEEKPIAEPKQQAPSSIGIRGAEIY